MPTNHIDLTHDECVDENKRALLVGGASLAVATAIMGTSSLAQEVVAQEVFAQKHIFEYVPSTIGIDYEQYGRPIGPLLSMGEAEWMENAKPAFEDETGDVWKEEFVPEVATGAISEYTAQDMREFTPNMLRTFSVALDPEDPKYGGLWSTGSSFLASQLT